MRARKLLIFGICGVFILVIGIFLSRVLAKQEGIKEERGSTVVTKDQYKSLFLTNGMVEVRKDIHGDLFVVGGTIVIQGNVAENLIMTGGRVKVTGDVGQSIIVAGGEVEINGKVGQDILCAGGMIKLQGEVGDDVRIVGGEIDVAESKIKGDLFAKGEKVTVDKKTVVHGEKMISQPTEEERQQRLKKNIVNWFVGTFIAMMGWPLLALGILKLAPVKTQKLVECAFSLKEAVLSFIVGLFSFPVALFSIILLFISRIGAPIAFVTILIGAAIVLVAWIFPVSGLTYKLLPEKRKSYLLAIIIGVPVVAAIRRLPVMGLIVSILLTVWGVGAIILTKFRMLVKKETIVNPASKSE